MVLELTTPRSEPHAMPTESASCPLFTVFYFFDLILWIWSTIYSFTYQFGFAFTHLLCVISRNIILLYVIGPIIYYFIQLIFKMVKWKGKKYTYILPVKIKYSPPVSLSVFYQNFAVFENVLRLELSIVTSEVISFGEGDTGLSSMACFSPWTESQSHRSSAWDNSMLHSESHLCF